MTAKEYLGQLPYISGCIKAKEQKYIEIEKRLFSCSKAITGMPKSQKSNDAISSGIASLAELKNKIVLDKLLLCQKEATIISQIDCLDNYLYKHLLTLKYVNNKTFEQIAVDMGYSWRQIIRLHGQALQYFATIHKKNMS